MPGLTAPCDYCAYYAELEQAEAPRTLAETTAVALEVNCGHCWARPGHVCFTESGGTHLARYGRSRRRGLISDADMCAVLDAAGDVFEPAAVIRLEAVPA